jgi:Uncharacterized membrane protein
MPAGSSPPIPPSLDDELLEELKTQLGRKFSNLFGGKLELANGILLYENQLDTSRNIYRVNQKKGGGKKASPAIHGNNFETLVAGQNNKQSILEGTNHKSYTTDQLAELEARGELPADIPENLVKTNHTQVDLVTLDAKGQVIGTAQLKNCQEKRTAKSLLKDRYVCTSYEEYEQLHEARINKCKNDLHSSDPGKADRARCTLARLEKMKLPKEKWTPPDKLIIPAEQYEKVKADLQELQKSKNPIAAAQAKMALKKIEKAPAGGGVSRDDSFSPQKAIVKETVKDFGKRTIERSGKLIMSELAMLCVGGAIWEIRDEIRCPRQTPIEIRVERLAVTIGNRLSTSLGLSLKKETALEIVNLVAGAFVNIFKSAKDFISFLGVKFREMWDHIYNYLTGKITSFHKLILAILKSVAAVGLAGLALALEEQLTLWGIPPILSGIFSASVAAVGIVLASRGLEAIVFGLVASFAKAEAAQLRADLVEAKCQELLPKMIEKRKELEALTQKTHNEREAILACSFQALNSPQGREDVNIVIAALERVNQVFGSTLEFRDFDEFDNLMLSDKALCL